MLFRSQAAAVLTFLCPGLRFFHQGQAEGRAKHIPVHLGRGPNEPTNAELLQFYERLVSCLRRSEAQETDWHLLECTPAWDGNWTSDCFICFGWRRFGSSSLLVAVNYSSHQSQCHVHIPFDEFRGKYVHLRDLMGPEMYDREGDEICSQGLYLDLPAWGYNVFEMSAAE